jgi:glycosyltransferase 2 family protein
MQGWFRALTAALDSPAGKIVRTIVSVCLIAWLLARFDWKSVADLGIERRPIAILGAVVLSFLAYPVCAWRWKILLRAQQVYMPYSDAHQTVWIGQFYNGFLPGGVGGDAARLARAVAVAPRRSAEVAVATFADRLFGFGVLAAFVPVVAVIQPELLSLFPDALSSAQAVALLASAAVVVLGAVFWLARRSLASNWVVAFRNAVGGPGLVSACVTLSIVVWILDFAAGWLLAHALGLGVSPVAMATALVFAYLSTVLPISLGGHGVRESAMVIVLVMLRPGTTAPDYAGLALLFLATTLASSVVGGLVLLASRPKTAANAAAHRTRGTTRKT